MSDIELHREGTHVLVKYRQSNGATINTVAGPVTEAVATGDGWIMKLSPTRDLGTVRLDGDARGAFVEVRDSPNTWRRIGVAEAIHTDD
jgi:hypothetical protein